MQPSTAFALLLFCGDHRNSGLARGTERQLLDRVRALVADVEASVLDAGRGSAREAGLQCRFKAADEVKCRWNATYSPIDCEALERANLDAGSLDLEHADMQVCVVSLGCA